MLNNLDVEVYADVSLLSVSQSITDHRGSKKGKFAKLHKINRCDRRTEQLMAQPSKKKMAHLVTVKTITDILEWFSVSQITVSGRELIQTKCRCRGIK